MELSQQLKEIGSALYFLLPELALISTVICVLILDLVFIKKSKAIVQFATFFGLVITAVIVYYQLQVGFALSDFLALFKLGHSNEYYLLSSLLRIDENVLNIKLLIDLATIGCLLIYTLNPKKEEQTQQEEGKSGVAEERIFWLSLLLGAHGMLMANNWISLYLGIELASISAYTLSVFCFKKKSAEAGIKYLIIGAFASALMLYGISWIYGFTGSLSFQVDNFVNEPLLMVGFVLAISGILFKIAVVPFQIWVPSVYQSAPIPVTAFFSIVPKIAGIYLLYHVVSSFNGILPNNFDKMLIGAIGIISMTWGNISALKQQNAARMMGYSSIAQAGLILVALSVFSEDIQILLFYFKIYILMNLIAFGVIAWVGSSYNLEVYKGLGKKILVVGISISIAMLALTGLPPTAGFTGKFLIFSSVWDYYQQSELNFFLGILILGVFNTVISLFYYLKLPYFMFFKSSESNPEIKFSVLQNAFLLILGLSLISLFITPF